MEVVQLFLPAFTPSLESLQKAFWWSSLWDQRDWINWRIFLLCRLAKTLFCALFRPLNLYQNSKNTSKIPSCCMSFKAAMTDNENLKMLMKELSSHHHPPLFLYGKLQSISIFLNYSWGSDHQNETRMDENLVSFDKLKTLMKELSPCRSPSLKVPWNFLIAAFWPQLNPLENDFVTFQSCPER